MARRSFGMPLDDEYRWLRGLEAASWSFSTIGAGVARSGLPMPKSTTSSPARRACILRSLTIEKTYGGNRSMRRNSIVRSYLPLLVGVVRARCSPVESLEAPEHERGAIAARLEARDATVAEAAQR